MGRAVCCKSVAQTTLTSCSCRIPFRMAKLMGRHHQLRQASMLLILYLIGPCRAATLSERL